MKKFTACVIGSGPGGYVAAIRLAQLGVSVCVVEREHLGGICLNWGCIPTKALLKSAEVFHSIKKSQEYGITIDDNILKSIKPDLSKIIDRSRGVAAKLSNGIAMLMKKNKIEVISGQASFKSSNEISVTKFVSKEICGLKSNPVIPTLSDIETISADYFIIATGARAREIKGFEPDGNLVLTYKEAMSQKTLPQKLLVVGSGAIGIEFASFYNTVGSNVTVFEMLDRIVPSEDLEISKLAEKYYKSQGLNIHTSINLISFVKNKNSITVEYKLSNGEVKKDEFDKIIMAVGVVPNTDKISIENTKVKKDDKGIVITDKYLQTNDEKIFAIGDVTTGPWLAHKASHEGIVAAEKIASKLKLYDESKIHPINRTNIPGCIYTNPQIASVGLTEQKAKELGYDIKVGRFSPAGNGKAIATNKIEGLVKTIFDKKTGELLGAHLIGGDVTEYISAFLVGKTMEGTDLDFISTIFPHPTLSEMIHESVLDSNGRVIHI